MDNPIYFEQEPSEYQRAPQHPKTPPPPDKPPKKRSLKRWLFALWGTFLLGIIICLGLFVGVAYGLLGKLPTFVELESPKSSLASEVYASEGELLGRIYVEDRTNTEFEELPQHLIDALISTEDIRFYEHAGIDMRGTGRAIVKTAFQGDRSSGGASTLTQQLAKNLFHKYPKSMAARLKQKVKEWVIAVKLERSYTKNEIMSMYLNTVSFSQNAHGIKAAARTYFSKSPDSLNIQESALLMGMLKASTRYNPVRNPKNALERRNVVLAQMAKYNYLTTAQKDSLQKLDLGINYKRDDHNVGTATYFREFVKQEVKRWAKNNVKVDGEQYDVFRDGLKIYTTIDYKMQEYAEEAVAENMRKLQKKFNKHWKTKDPWYKKRKIEKVKNSGVKKDDPWAGTNELIYRAAVRSERYREMKKADVPAADIYKSFNKKTSMSIFSWNGDQDTVMTPLDSIRYYKRLLHAGFMVVDPMSGHIKAWVGGIDHKHFQYDNARPSSKKQVGSTFKPFVYTVAINNGISPCEFIPNIPVSFPKYENWTPQNSNNRYNGQYITVKKGLALSLNQITASLMKQVGGPGEVIELVRKMGFEKSTDVPAFPSICLGTPEISLYEMVGAYTTYANKGFYIKPISITHIKDKNGNLVQPFVPIKSEVINEEIAYAMLHMMKGVTDYGTAVGLRSRHKLKGEIAGKTGTTDDNSDGWYIGITPQLVAGAWVGGDEKAIRFTSTRLGSGSAMAMPIFGSFMEKAYADESLELDNTLKFERPPSMGIELNCNNYMDPYYYGNPSAGGGQPMGEQIIVNPDGSIQVVPAQPQPGVAPVPGQVQQGVPVPGQPAPPSNPEYYNDQFD